MKKKSVQKWVSLMMFLLFFSGCQVFSGDSQKLQGEKDTSERLLELAEGYRNIYEEMKAARKEEVKEEIKEAEASYDISECYDVAEIEKIVDYVGTQGYAVVDEENQQNMRNFELAEEFCYEASEGNHAEVEIIVVESQANLHCYGLEAADDALLVTETILSWVEDEPVISYTDSYEAETWNYTDGGYLFFEEYYPDGYDGAPAQVGIRIQHLDSACRELNRKYVLPIGYEGNNLLITNWNELSNGCQSLNELKSEDSYSNNVEENFEENSFYEGNFSEMNFGDESFYNVDFYDLYEKIYMIKYRTKTPYEENVTCVEYEIPEKEFEEVIQTYFNIDTRTLRQYTVYNENNKTYRYRPRTMYDAIPPYEPYPEVISYEEQPDGTIKLFVKAVWTRKMEECAWLSELVVRPLEDGGFQYVSNTVLDKNTYWAEDRNFLEKENNGEKSENMNDEYSAKEEVVLQKENSSSNGAEWYTSRLGDSQWEYYYEMEHSSSEAEQSNLEQETYVGESGYNLPVSDEVKTEAETDCLSIMELIKEIYLEMDKGTAMNTVITREIASEMLSAVKSTGKPSMASSYNLNMENYEAVDTFLNNAQKGKLGEVTVYEVHSGGGIARKEFIFDGVNMYLLETKATWNEKNKAMINYTTYNRLSDWQYTEKGWFIYELSLPELSDRINGNDMFRVKPLENAWREICEQYLIPLGYQGNNLLCSDWDSDHLEDLDYPGLFQYFYEIEYGVTFDGENYENGIPKDTFEALITKYLPVTWEQLQKVCAYQEENETYLWRSLGQMSYRLNFFATSVPEIVDVKEHADGSITLTVDAVCNLKGSDMVIRHELTVLFMQNGDIRYLSNQVLNDGLNNIPEYQYRME